MTFTAFQQPLHCLPACAACHLTVSAAAPEAAIVISPIPIAASLLLNCAADRFICFTLYFIHDTVYAREAVPNLSYNCSCASSDSLDSSADEQAVLSCCKLHVMQAVLIHYALFSVATSISAQQTSVYDHLQVFALPFWTLAFHRLASALLSVFEGARCINICHQRLLHTVPIHVTESQGFISCISCLIFGLLPKCNQCE